MFYKSNCSNIVKVAELYEDLEKRVSQFNMKVPENSQPLDYTSMHRQKFILQVRVTPQTSHLSLYAAEPK